MEYSIELKNNTKFRCKDSETILSAAESAGITLEHSCLTGRCRSCRVQIIDGKVNPEKEETVLTDQEKADGFTLACNSKPLSNLKLNIEDLGDVVLVKKKTFPCKVRSLEKITSNVIKVILRLPPTADFSFLAGQYVNIIKGNIKRSYSLASYTSNNSTLEFFIKNYKGGQMSQYWFEEAKINDLLRLEGPLGTFFYRDKEIEEIILLATGTGIAPVKAMLAQFSKYPHLVKHKKVILVWGGRLQEDIFWKPSLEDHNDFEFIPVLSRAGDEWRGEKGYVQNVLVNKMNCFANAHVYACGSNEMITSAKSTLINKGLPENQFFSDAFICSN